MHQHKRRMRPAPYWLPEYCVQRGWAIGSLFRRMRRNGDCLGLRHGWHSQKRQQQEYQAQHCTMKKQPSHDSQYEILTKTNAR
ncbi:MAG: hypothetical protein INF56_14305 [Roseomonas sp.]|nr:hypothetical protein [Roseomonas sp.]MCA3400420.1 hypothetical protein [Roseomonas sp.]MCA3404795.1 hypothetical protein [Roseomonas sp.]